MTGLSEEMKQVVLEQKLGFAATVCPDGTPNLSPKGTTTLWDDDNLLFADIHSPNTVRNPARQSGDRDQRGRPPSGGRDTVSRARPAFTARARHTSSR